MATAAETATLKMALRSSFPCEQSWVFHVPTSPGTDLEQAVQVAQEGICERR